MLILVTGASGQLGHDLLRELRGRGCEAIGLDIAEMDITDAESVHTVIAGAAPDCVIHCAAWTAVDAAEDNEAQCRLVNVSGTENIAKACRFTGCKMLYISTDYVFPGDGVRPWEPDDERRPLNVYGQTKYEGELAVQNNLSEYFIVRTSWVFGKNGSNFVRTILKLGRERGEVRVVNDQIGSPTYTADLAVLLADLAASDCYGIYHAVNEGFCSWYDFACEIFRAAGVAVKTIPVATEEYITKAKRPKNSRMNTKKLTDNGFSLLPGWQDALQRYLAETGELHV